MKLEDALAEATRQYDIAEEIAIDEHRLKLVEEGLDSGAVSEEMAHFQVAMRAAREVSLGTLLAAVRAQYKES